MSRMTTIVRLALCCSLFALLGACASMYGKGKDAGSNRLGSVESPVAGVTTPIAR